MNNIAKTIDICICTFRRPQIADTLKSLSDMIIPYGYTVSIIIADNDDTDHAKDSILKTANSFNLKTTYIHAPARNISIARNACLDSVTADIAIFIDDDERVSPKWLTAMIARHERTQAPIILGPVQAIYADHHPHWMKENNFHSINPVWVNGEIITGYTSNLLLDQTITDIKSQRFLIELGQSGGEDSTFLSALHKKGHDIEFAKDAIVTEDVADNRASFKWLFDRRFRMGQTHARLNNEKLRTLVMATLKMLFCFTLGIAFFWNKTKSSFWILRGALHYGAIMGVLGQDDLKQYGDIHES